MEKVEPGLKRKPSRSLSYSQASAIVNAIEIQNSCNSLEVLNFMIIEDFTMVLFRQWTVTANTKKPTSLTHLRLLGRVVPVSSVTNRRIGDNDGGGEDDGGHDGGGGHGGGGGGGGHGGPSPGGGLVKLVK